MSRFTRNLFAAALAFAAAPAVAGELPAGFPLSKPPVDALADLGKLPGAAAGKPSDAERKLLTDAWKRSNRRAADRPAIAPADAFDAILFACGIESAEVRAKYRRRFDDLVADAEKAVADAKTPADKCEALVKFLHAGPMKNGYCLEQSRLDEVFDTGKFNCVSSTAMVYLVGSRLGLELVPQEVPGNGFQAGHAWLEAAIDGKRVDVECTNADGFDFETKLKQPGVIRIGPGVDRANKRETDGFGVAAMTYSNRGVGEKECAPAIRWYLSALALDPTDRTAANNLRSAFVNWGPKLREAGQYEDAVAVLAHGLKLMPGCEKMLNNQRVVWTNYLDDTLDKNADAKFADRLARAKAAVGGKDFDTAAEWYTRLAHRRIPKGWENALAVLDRAMTAVPASERNALRNERVGMCRMWSQDRLAAGDADGSLKALQAAKSDGGELEAGLAYHTQEALATVAKSGGSKAVAEHFAAIRKAFPKSKAVEDVAATHVRRTVTDAARNGSLDAALKTAKELDPLLPTADAKADVDGNAYCEAAGKLADERNWDDALKVFADGLKAYPKHGRLRNNAVATVDRWARTAMDKSDWDEAIRIYDVGLKHLPGDGHLTHNKEYCEEKKGK